MRKVIMMALAIFGGSVFAGGGHSRQQPEDLIEAAKEGDYITCLKLLTVHGFREHINAFDDEGKTALYHAARKGHFEIVKLLIHSGIDINYGNSNYTTPLLVAAEHGHIEVVRLLLKMKADVNKSNVGDETPLVYAVKNGHLDIVKLLLDYNADINATIMFEKGLLHLAAEGGHLEVVKFLLEKGQDIDKFCTNLDGQVFTPFALAALNGHSNVVKLLLEKGSDISLYADCQEYLDQLSDDVKNVINNFRARAGIEITKHSGMNFDTANLVAEYVYGPQTTEQARLQDLMRVKTGYAIGGEDFLFEPVDTRMTLRRDLTEVVQPEIASIFTTQDSNCYEGYNDNNGRLTEPSNSRHETEMVQSEIATIFTKDSDSYKRPIGRVANTTKSPHLRSRHKSKNSKPKRDRRKPANLKWEQVKSCYGTNYSRPHVHRPEDALPLNPDRFLTLR